MPQIIFALLLLFALSPTIGLAADARTDDFSRVLQQHLSGWEANDEATREAVHDLERFYALHGFRPMWNEPSRLDRLIAALEGLEADGLDPARYALEELRKVRGVPARDLEDLLCRDIVASHAYLQAMIHLTRGRLAQGTVEHLWRNGRLERAPERDFVVARAAAGVDDVVATFARARPDVPLYEALRRAYVRLREQAVTQDWPHIPAGPSLREGDIDERVPLLRQRLEMAGYATTTPENPYSYDPMLVAAAMRFQHDHQLEPDGIVGRATLEVLNVPMSTRLEQLRANLERIRWLTHEMGPNLVLVDIAGARITYFRNGEPAWTSRTQVGRANRPTPLLRSEITHFTLNPTWTVPPTILRDDKLPEIRKDIDYLAQNRFRVLDYSGNEIAPQQVDWDHPGQILLRQDAGPGNALGQVAIRFPNPFSVYLHDTPSQSLFARDRRTVSSGCVRVERALDLVDLLVADGSDIPPDRIAAVLTDGRTRNISLARPIPVLLAYWTADIAPDGQLRFRKDMYGHDEKIIRALAEVDRSARNPVAARCMQRLDEIHHLHERSPAPLSIPYP